MEAAKVAVALVVLVLLIVLIVLGPIFTIWSLNTLFGLHIPTTFQTWAAVIWLITIFHGIRFQLKRD